VRRAGFLLAEALVTLALSAIILVGLASVVGLLLRSGDRAAAAAERQEVASRAAAALVRDIAAAAPVRWAGAGAPFVFDGRADRLVLAVAGPAAVRAVALEAEPLADGGTRLLRAETVLPPAAEGIGDVAFPDATEILRTPGAIVFRFAGRTQPDAPEIVAEAWPSGPAHPAAVLAEIGPAGAAASLRIAFAVTAEPGCAAAGKPCSLRAGDDAEDEDEDAAEQPPPGAAGRPRR
jgi:hypothetical protein